MWYGPGGVCGCFRVYVELAELSLRLGFSCGLGCVAKGELDIPCPRNTSLTLLGIANFLGIQIMWSSVDMDTKLQFT